MFAFKARPESCVLLQDSLPAFSRLNESMRVN